MANKLCQLTCAPFYNNPTLTTLTQNSAYSEDPLGPEGSCGYCIYQAHMDIGGVGRKSSCQDACNIDGIVNRNPYGFTEMCGPNGLCKAADCVRKNLKKCPEMGAVMFGGMTNDKLDKACGQCSTKETYCSGCSDGENYYQLDNAYAPHVLRR